MRGRLWPPGLAIVGQVLGGGKGAEQARQSPPLLSVSEGRGWGGGQARCESLKLKQGPAAWGCCVCLRSRLLIGIMWGSGRGGDSCDRRDASRRSAQPRAFPQPAPHLGRRAGAGRDGGAGGGGAGEAPSFAPSLG